MSIASDPHVSDARNDACSPVSQRNTSFRVGQGARGGRDYGDDNIAETTCSLPVSTQLSSSQVARDNSTETGHASFSDIPSWTRIPAATWSRIS